MGGIMGGGEIALTEERGGGPNGVTGGLPFG